MYNWNYVTFIFQNQLFQSLQRLKIKTTISLRINIKRSLNDRLYSTLKSIKIRFCVFQTVFAKGGGHSLDAQSQLGYEVIGLDWTVDPVEARKIVGDNITLQGNLDPQDLYKSPVSFHFCRAISVGRENLLHF